MTVSLFCVFRVFRVFRVFCGSRSSERKPRNTQKTQNRFGINNTTGILSVLFLISTLVISATSQELPNEIRGYKVHRDKITVSASPDLVKKPTTDAVIKMGDPDLVDVALSGITFALTADLKPLSQSGKVDFLTFHDFRVNGVAVMVEEYSHPFEFKKNELVVLPKPALLFLPTNNLLKAAWKEMRESKSEWTVKGRIFVFGRFKRFGFYHKRVVPIEIDLHIANPYAVVSQGR